MSQGREYTTLYGTVGRMRCEQQTEDKREEPRKARQRKRGVQKEERGARQPRRLWCDGGGRRCTHLVVLVPGPNMSPSPSKSRTGAPARGCVWGSARREGKIEFGDAQGMLTVGEPGRVQAGGPGNGATFVCSRRSGRQPATLRCVALRQLGGARGRGGRSRKGEQRVLMGSADCTSRVKERRVRGERRGSQ